MGDVTELLFGVLRLRAAAVSIVADHATALVVEKEFLGARQEAPNEGAIAE